MYRPITGYLSQLASLCLEVSRRPELLPLFVAIILRAPSTLEELAGAARTKRIAA